MKSQKEILATLFNEWQRRYMNNPERFEREWQSVAKTLEQLRRGEKVTYGDECAAYLLQLAHELDEEF